MILKCRLDPFADNSGYAGVVRVVRDNGSARMENGTLVIENASSILLLSRIEWFSDYSEKKVDALRRAVDAIKPDYAALLERHRPVLAEAFSQSEFQQAVLRLGHGRFKQDSIFPSRNTTSPLAYSHVVSAPCVIFPFG